MMLKYFALAAFLLQIQVCSVYAKNSDIDTGLKDEQIYQLNFKKLKQEEASVRAFIQALKKFNNKDHQGAIVDFTKAIKIDPNYKDAYIFRGISRNSLEDYQGAILDFTKAININPSDANAYGLRASSRHSLGDYQGFIVDLNQSANLHLEQGNMERYQQTLSLIKNIQRRRQE